MIENELPEQSTFETVEGEPEFDVIDASPPEPTLEPTPPEEVVPSGPKKPVLCLMGEFSAGKKHAIKSSDQNQRTAGQCNSHAIAAGLDIERR